jgi:hypothetical protein
MSYLYSKLPETVVSPLIGTGGTDALPSDDDALQIALLFEVDNIARVHVFGDERAVKHDELQRLGAPDALSKCGIAAF